MGLFPSVHASASASSPDPFPTWGAMVDRLYVDLTAVAPTSAQRSAAVAAAAAGTQTPGGLVAALRTSEDHQVSVDPVTRLYRAFLLRIPDKGGLEFWIKRRRTGTWTLNRIADSFARSSEFERRYGALSNLAFVKLIYDNVLERPYDQGGLNFWTRQLDSKRKSRGAVMANFSESPEYKRKQAAEVTASALWIMLLGRAPTSGEFASAVEDLEGGRSVTDLSATLLGSAEYAKRVTGPLAITVPAIGTLYAGIPLSVRLTAAGGFGPRTWTATGLPSWLTIDSETGELSGTPPAAGVTAVTAKLTAGAGMETTKQLSLDVKPGMPTGCVTTDCAQLDANIGTIQIPSASVSRGTRNAAGAVTAVSLTAAAPNVAIGNILVVEPGTHTPSGLIARVTAVTGANGAARVATVVPSTLVDAYASGIVKETDTEPIGASNEGARRAFSSSCSGDADLEITPEVSIGLQPSVALLWGKNIAGFGSVFVGTGGVKAFQFDLGGELTFRLQGSMSGSVECALDVPGPTAAIPLGPAGFLFFKLRPTLTLAATAGMEIDTTVTLRCGINVTYYPTSTSRAQWCHPSATPPKVKSAGADLTIGGGIEASITFNELVGLSGDLTASVRARYQPLSNPLGSITGKVTSSLSACLACMFGDGPSLTIASGTLLDRDFYTWNSPADPPTFPLSMAPPGLPAARLGQPYSAALSARGGTKPYTFTAVNTPPGLSLATNGTLSGTPSTQGFYPVVLSVRDAKGATASVAITFTVSAGTPLAGVTTVATGPMSDHSCAVVAAGGVKCWGYTPTGAVGDGTTGDSNNVRVSPRTVTGISGATAVATGAGHSCAVIAGGTVKCWGAAGYGELGDGTTGDSQGRRLVPVTVSGVSGATQVTAGSNHTCALVAGGLVKCWGKSDFGQVGDGTFGDDSGVRLQPVTVLGVEGAVQISAGSRSTCAVLGSGSIKCWGFNLFGQLGDGSKGDSRSARPSPVTVGLVTDAVAVASGANHACALMSAGTVKCWGDAAFGQMGDGATGDFEQRSLLPRDVAGVTGATQLTAGSTFACVLRSDSPGLCWGSNGWGQLGNGTTGDEFGRELLPVGLSVASGGELLSAGDSYTCSLLAEGQVECWGRNEFGELGDGTTGPPDHRQLTPVKVIA
jgi:alpha-tubulin suppressor-like RCC1 family protein